MGVETETREAEVRVVRCDHLRVGETGLTELACEGRTTLFVDVTEQGVGVIPLDGAWVSLRWGVTAVRYFCGWEHAGEWVTAGRLLPLVGTGIQGPA